MLNLQQRNKLVRRINKLIKAEIEDSWKGGGDPADIPIIEVEVKFARERLMHELDRLTVYTKDN